ncbi:hypothetical protein SmJEL517_g04623 [Synchytrium microbalum]|uniref:Calcium/calmodulin-dependent protein kinase II association-domain domain-containing protein n=1 Tax=Synchytrium microbalum TaxID=1806994 RepID=A0A507BR71_9FUNG|nr:uncharacterized protein SmJEL517_g04623 [Synchytrium microbalum]TPX32210.1 hypothetical protein SmJEL517_g04623 [Synchytrium microbalum]
MVVFHVQQLFEPEAGEHQVEGLLFHKFYFEPANNNTLFTPQAAVTNPPIHTTLIDPRVRILAPGAACISYVRLTQSVTRDGQAFTKSSQETRVWSRDSIDGTWRNVHFHRSGFPSAPRT